MSSHIVSQLTAPLQYSQGRVGLYHSEESPCLRTTAVQADLKKEKEHHQDTPEPLKWQSIFFIGFKVQQTPNPTHPGNSQQCPGCLLRTRVWGNSSACWLML